MKNSDRFLSAFNAIEDLLKKITRTNHHARFFQLIDYAKRNNAVVKKYQDDLKEFAELRNAIVHERHFPNYVIAEPHDPVVEKIEFILNEISEPKTVIPTFAKDVVVYDVHQTLADVLKAINRFSFTHFPIYDQGKFLGLLSQNGIAHWLGKNVDVNIASFSEILLGNVLAFEENGGNFQFIPKNMNVYEAKELFRHGGKNHPPKLNALLITEHGKPEEKMLGIITAWDIIKIQ